MEIKKIKNKGKVHPSPSSSSSSSSKDREVVLSVLKLLPAAILALASVLSLEDREVLAYLITRSLKTPSSSSSSSSSSSDSKNKSSKKAQNGSRNGGAGSTGHKPPVFDCDCFDCYTSYWVRWDSSPNRELIHQVIEAFEDHLANGEKSSSKKINGRGKRRDKLGRNREAQKVALLATDGPARPDSPLPETSSTTTTDTSAASVASVETAPCAENAVVLVTQVEEKSPDGFEGNEKKENDAVEADEEEELSEAADDDAAAVLPTMAASEHKGLARKLREDHHLKHGGRMQLGLFLKGVGLKLDDAIAFWKAEFSQKVGAERFDKEYAYSIRHNYGREGKRTDYSPYSCQKIISSTPGAGDHHGCPYRHFSEENLRAALNKMGIDSRAVENVMDKVQNIHYQLACTLTFEAVHNSSCDSGINHPNQYFSDSQKILQSKNHSAA